MQCRRRVADPTDRRIRHERVYQADERGASRTSSPPATPTFGCGFFGANAAIRERLGGGPPPEWLRLGDPFTPARQSLGDEVYDRAWQAGLAMTVDEAVALALAGSEG
jgi:hypothetical protein